MNSNLFIIPYMQYHKIPPSPLEIQLTRETVHRAAALSIARYFILLATSTIILVIRGILFWNFTPTLGLRVVILLSEIGRWLMVLIQTAAVLTYSCQHKAVGTWFVLIDNVPTSRLWNRSTQNAFRALVWENMTYMWHAKIVFWIVEKTVVVVTGCPFFSKFTSPAQAEYEVVNGATDLVLLVYDDDVSPVVDDSPKYTIKFRNTPGIILLFSQTYLEAALGLRLFVGVPLLVLGFFGVVAPVLFALYDPPDPKAKYFWFVEQIVVALVKYYDWEDWRINTTFGRGVPLRLEHGSDRTTRVSGDGSDIAGPSTFPRNEQNSAEEVDITETLGDTARNSYLKAAMTWAESSQQVS